MSMFRRAALAAYLVMLVPLSACVVSGSPAPTRTIEPTATTTATPTVTPTATASATPAPTVTPTPPPAALEFEPAQITQGGVTVVYLNRPATAATATFNGRQYPMASDGLRWWAILATGAFADPDVYSVSVTYTTPAGGQETVRDTVTVADKSYPVEDIILDPETAALLDPAIVQAEYNFRVNLYSGFTPQRLWSGAFVWPSPNANSSFYGEARSYNGGPVTSYHTGTDFVGEVGSPVVAAAAGRVVFTGDLRVRGGSVIIDHGLGVYTAYHHFSRIDVQEGQVVSAGQLIGAIGETGLVTGPHLHWEVIVRGVEVDGMQWLQGSEIGP